MMILVMKGGSHNFVSAEQPVLSFPSWRERDTFLTLYY